jgi:hypothetical protein
MRCPEGPSHGFLTFLDAGGTVIAHGDFGAPQWKPGAKHATNK